MSGPAARAALITALFQPPRFPIAALRDSADAVRAMNPYPHLADAAWLRLAIVGADILALVVTVRLCSALAAWWRTLHAHRPTPATVRPPPGATPPGAAAGFTRPLRARPHLLIQIKCRHCYQGYPAQS